MYSRIVIICMTIVVLMFNTGCSIKKATEFNYIEEGK